MLTRKLKKIIASLLVSAMVFTGGCQGIKHITKAKEFKVTSEQTIQNANKNVIKAETILERLQGETKVIVGSASLSKDVSINSKIQNNLFKNNTTIKIKAIGNFVLDLSKINKENIRVTGDIISIYTSVADIDVNFEFDSFEYSNEKGVFVGDSKKMNAEDWNSILDNVKSGFESELKNGEDYVKFNKEQCQKSIDDILEFTTSEYKIKLIFIE